VQNAAPDKPTICQKSADLKITTWPYAPAR
jgi:hypothetical protein